MGLLASWQEGRRGLKMPSPDCSAQQQRAKHRHESPRRSPLPLPPLPSVYSRPRHSKRCHTHLCCRLLLRLRSRGLLLLGVVDLRRAARAECGKHASLKSRERCSLWN